MDGGWVARARWRRHGASGWLARARWRRRGAWLWPAFVVLTLADALVGRLLPFSGNTQSVATGAVAGLCLNVVGVILLSRPLGWLIRRLRPSVPNVVARNYGGSIVVIAVFVALSSAGLAHRSSVLAERRAMQEAVARAQAWIGDRAPAPFRRNLALVDMFAIQAGSVYRSCVPSQAPSGPRDYCVIVNLSAPFAGSVKFAGSEPNSMFSAGVG
ncbi:MAG TPA: hypothetical protein VGY32_09890 [Solirubrobacteraceae bacterium]|jgi:hypothetical protein|nr:hypothetical protein [Solirubrobacteraceae bacterium]